MILVLVWLALLQGYLQSPAELLDRYFQAGQEREAAELVGKLLENPSLPVEVERAVGGVCVRRGQPYGSEPWRLRIAAQLGLESTFRPRGRPRKPER